MISPKTMIWNYGVQVSVSVFSVSNGRTHETSLGGSLASNLGPRVLGEAGVKDGITDLVGNLVGVTLADRLGYTRTGSSKVSIRA